MWVVLIIASTVGMLTPAAVAPVRWHVRHRRAARAAAWVNHASALTDEAHSLVQLVLTLSANPRRMDGSALWTVVGQQFVRLSQSALNLYQPAPNPATRNALEGLRLRLVALEREVARHRTRPLIRAEAAGEGQAFRTERHPQLRQRVDEVSFAASFLAIAAYEDLP